MRIGETFKDVGEGKKAIKRYCFEYEVAYYVVSSDKKRFAIQCPSRKEDKDGRCQFHMNLTSMYGGGARLIKYKPHHPFCSAKAKVGHEGLVQEAIYVLENVEDATPNDVISSIRYSHGMTVPYRTAWHILTKLRKERQIAAKPNSIKTSVKNGKNVSSKLKTLNRTESHAPYGARNAEEPTTRKLRAMYSGNDFFSSLSRTCEIFKEENNF
ncbi:hypothetical protein NDN08_005529 [Rhodosorus marinus]|uniref:Transposase MuDR plant domain-containing protein n=1 Tax=Rhodosorus marinus TaxID=101924 RepID=A0AAV8V1U8_9RHOD|nr:hypothetical protein NDN08_005529 [Rhodosorus marinus]